MSKGICQSSGKKNSVTTSQTRRSSLSLKIWLSILVFCDSTSSTNKFVPLISEEQTQEREWAFHFKLPSHTFTLDSTDSGIQVRKSSRIRQTVERGFEKPVSANECRRISTVSSKLKQIKTSTQHSTVIFRDLVRKLLLTQTVTLSVLSYNTVLVRIFWTLIMIYLLKILSYFSSSTFAKNIPPRFQCYDLLC